MPRSTPAVGLAALLFCACGAPATSSTAETTPAHASVDANTEWSAPLLRRLDHDLRAHVRRGTESRLAIKVYFRASPSEDDLAALLLSRVGSQVVGNVRLATLHRIATREDVDHIESLTDVGY